MTFLIIKKDELNDLFGNFMYWMREHVFFGFLFFICIVFFSTVLFIPGSIVLMGCGYAFS